MEKRLDGLQHYYNQGGRQFIISFQTTHMRNEKHHNRLAFANENLFDENTKLLYMRTYHDGNPDHAPEIVILADNGVVYVCKATKYTDRETGAELYYCFTLLFATEKQINRFFKTPLCEMNQKVRTAVRFNTEIHQYHWDIYN